MLIVAACILIPLGLLLIVGVLGGFNAARRGREDAPAQPPVKEFQPPAPAREIEPVEPITKAHDVVTPADADPLLAMDPDDPRPQIVRRVLQAHQAIAKFATRAEEPALPKGHAQQYASAVNLWRSHEMSLLKTLAAERAEAEEFALTLQGPEAQRKFPVFGTMSRAEQKATEAKQEAWMKEQAKPELTRIAKAYALD